MTARRREPRLRFVAPGEDEPTWVRVATLEEFCRLFADRELVAGELRFTIHTDGRLTGQVGDALLLGSWVWKNGYFCRTACLDNEDLGTDCELIQTDGNRMKYFPAKGAGEATIVS